MGFDIDNHVEFDESLSEPHCFDSFDHMVSAFVINCYGGRLNKALLACFVDELDLSEALINLLK